MCQYLLGHPVLASGTLKAGESAVSWTSTGKNSKRFWNYLSFQLMYRANKDTVGKLFSQRSFLNSEWK